MKRVGFFYNPIFQEHRTAPGHPENHLRLEAILRAVRTDPISESLHWIEKFPSRAPETLYAVHDPDYIELVRSRVAAGEQSLDFIGETNISPHSWDAALMAADAAVEAVEQVRSGKLDRAFAAVRPPGHHAEHDRAMGFCIFNNIAVAASYLLSSGMKRVAIVDWDVHHGNGTQHAFEADNRVLFISLHEFPHYPGTGARHEHGIGEGVGTTLNIPMAAGSGDEDYISAFENEVIPAIEEFFPEMILISAGFDAHAADPLASIQLQTEMYGKMTRMLCDAAERQCDGRVVAILEGGYDFTALGEGVVAHLKEMLA